MNGGAISGNTGGRTSSPNAFSTGGVSNLGGSTFVMNGGTINGNTGGSSRDAGGVHNLGGNFTMNGGTISGNMGGTSGGVINAGTFTMNNGTISNNNSLADGGGMHNAGVFTMYGGTITNNVAARNGGGIEHSGQLSVFNFYGGWIFNNTAAVGNDVHLGGGAFNNNLPNAAAGAIGSPPPAGTTTQTQQPTTTPPPAQADTPAANEVRVTINNQPVNFDGQGPVIVDGRTLVPVRGVFEALDFDVDWDQASQTAHLTRTGQAVTISIGSSTFTVNGTSRQLDVPAQNIGGRTMLPIRAVLESVGYNVDWDGATSTILVTAP